MALLEEDGQIDAELDQNTETVLAQSGVEGLLNADQTSQHGLIDLESAEPVEPAKEPIGVFSETVSEKPSTSDYKDNKS